MNDLLRMKEMLELMLDRFLDTRKKLEETPDPNSLTIEELCNEKLSLHRMLLYRTMGLMDYYVKDTERKLEKINKEIAEYERGIE